ncbi:MAG: amidohydrolase [Firmicutes bacterium]|nr:amidohydrolase [Bacillota bacterium]
MPNKIREIIGKYRIIDAHGHLGYYKLFNIPDSSAEGILKTMDRVGIEKICVSSLAGLEVDYKYGNDMVADAIKSSKGRILGYACVNPFEQNDVIPELERCFDKLNMTAIKLHPDLSDCPADSKKYIPVYEFAHQRKLVIMNHSWGSAQNLRSIADKYYNIKFIQAHYGSAWDGNQELEILKAIRDLDNVWLDTAGSGCYLGAFEKTVDFLGADKIVFGSDFPFFDPCHQLGNVVLSNISEEDKVKILSINFLKLVNII